MRVGIRFSLHPFITGFLFDIKALPCQLGMNVWSQLNVFIILYEKMNVVLTPELFRELFSIKVNKGVRVLFKLATGKKTF